MVGRHSSFLVLEMLQPYTHYNVPATLPRHTTVPRRGWPSWTALHTALCSSAVCAVRCSSACPRRALLDMEAIASRLDRT